jgi:hypothetical protein
MATLYQGNRMAEEVYVQLQYFEEWHFHRGGAIKEPGGEGFSNTLSSEDIPLHLFTRLQQIRSYT